MLDLFQYLSHTNMMVSLHDSNNGRKPYIIALASVSRTAAKVQRVFNMIKSACKSCKFDEMALNQHLKSINSILKPNLPILTLKECLFSKCSHTNILNLKNSTNNVINSLYHAYKNFNKEDIENVEEIDSLEFLDESTRKRLLLNSGTTFFEESEGVKNSNIDMIFQDSELDKDDKGQSR